MPIDAFPLPGCVTVETPAPDFPVLHVSHPAATARIALQGAHVLEWKPAGQDEVLFLSPQAVFAPGKPVRGGIPICWPWFNAHPDDPNLPMHGFARLCQWTLTAATSSDAEVELRFSLTSDANTAPWWPHAFHLETVVTVGRSLRVELTTANRAAEPVVIREALHTYLSAGDIHRATVRGLDDTPYLDTVGEHARRHQTDVIRFDREIDRQYTSTGPVTVEDPAAGRTLIIEKEGSATTVVWNPWIEKSKRLADLPDDAFLRFLCIEAANTDEAAVTIAPGASHRLATRVLVR